MLTHSTEEIGACQGTRRGGNFARSPFLEYCSRKAWKQISQNLNRMRANCVSGWKSCCAKSRLLAEVSAGAGEFVTHHHIARGGAGA